MEKAKYYIIHQTLVDPDVAMKNRKIISENAFSSNGVNLLTLTFTQVLQDFGVRNWNGRVYSQDIVMKGLNNNPLVQHDLKMHTWTGEYGHPIITKGMNEVARQMTIFPPNACWTIDKYWVEGNYLLGECTTLAGGYGDMVRDRILTNYPAQASSRAIGGIDASGNVLPNYTPITFDCVIRPSHKTAYMQKDTVHENLFTIPTGEQNTMSESVISYDFTKDPSFGNFLLAENTSKYQIEMLCETFKLDVNSMKIDKKNVTFETLTENGVDKVVIPLNQLINAEYYNLF